MCDFIYRDEGGAEFYTGHSQQERKMLWDLLGPGKDLLQVWGKPEGFLNNQIRDLSIECQFLITLMILRRNKTYTECGHQFGVCPTIVSMVFKTWLKFMNVTFKHHEDFIIEKDNKFKKKPKAFRNKLLKDTEFVLDCTEFPVESTKNYEIQGNNWSDYKHGQTKKLFLAVNPWGCATVVSKLADGSMSDREITKRCGFLKKKKIKGKTVLADRGFQIEDLILAKGGKLVIPPFLAGRKKFTYKELVRSRIITRARIHIERFNQRLKLYKFIGDKIPYYKLDIIDDAVFVCCMLVNFSRVFAK